MASAAAGRSLLQGVGSSLLMLLLLRGGLEVVGGEDIICREIEDLLLVARASARGSAAGAR